MKRRHDEGVKADAGRNYRAYPTEDQDRVLTGWGHTARALWNVALEQRVYLWEQRRYTLRSVEQCKHLTAARAELDWMGDLPAQSGQQILRQLDHLLTTIAQIAKLTTRRANRRRDFTHKLTTDLAKNHGLIGIEDLRVKNMSKSAKGTAQAPGRNVRAKAGLNRSILDNTPGERRRQLEYKTRLYGSVLVAVPPFHTSQTCAACGLVDPESRKGCGRLFACAHCGHEDDADHNASVEIEARARRTGGLDINSTRSIPRVRVPAVGRRRMREAPTPVHAS
ncbi:RNA-guided endonuclease TnpB family protein [Streptomyces sp. NBC_00047]|uniref:RNA-guided endonuclease InsQ/TnpB family protein n=1 Tax=Streptomyces sp. NBC_00047 TaxID=2975627 RepID=UPI0022558674|nr:RNA-guided endonuclease TnpB family protein [Streptomyces sp. NBC_00047]MCX5607413.1 RNA-guided endonuclease TnpB family protein [Streptomyces sp. NBC_00047]